MVQVSTFHLEAPVARVFPLFTAEGERRWAEGWDPEQLSGAEGRGSAFRTTHGGRTTHWIVTLYQPTEGRVSYARIAQDSNIGLVDVTCRSAADGGTDVSVRYTLTAITPQGERFVREFLDPPHYRAMIDEWRVRTGKALATDR